MKSWSDSARLKTSKLMEEFSCSREFRTPVRIIPWPSSIRHHLHLRRFA